MSGYRCRRCLDGGVWHAPNGDVASLPCGGSHRATVLEESLDDVRARVAAAGPEVSPDMESAMDDLCALADRSER